MSEIAKCPHCKKAPERLLFNTDIVGDGHKCCGHTADTKEQWNQYAAAMEAQKELKVIKVTLKQVEEYCDWSNRVRRLAQKALAMEG